MLRLCQALPSVHLVTAAIADLVFVVTFCHSENVIDAHTVSSFSEGATTLESTSEVLRTLMGVLADDAKQTA